MNDILINAINHYGRNNQIIVAIEELSELQKELTKELRGIGDINHIIEEIADVEIMIGQLQLIFSDVPNLENAIKGYKNMKLQKLRYSINEKEKEG